MTRLRDDLRLAVRTLRRSPGFSVLAAVTLALGIGGTIALFSVTYGLLVRPLPVPAEDQVQVFWMPYNWRGTEFDHIRDVPDHFESLAAFSNEAYAMRSGGDASLVLATVASIEVWDVLDVRPLHGRTFLPGEDRPGSEPVVVLGHGIWEREFGSDPGVVGRRVLLDGIETTIVGVMPEGFYFPTPDYEIFVPLELDPSTTSYQQNGWLILTGRLRDGATENEIAGDLGAITAALGERYSYSIAFDKTREPRLTPLREYLLGDVRPAVLVLLSAAGLILLMACVNVAALLLTRTVDRARELSVRVALGADRTRIARQVLTESVVLGLVAGAAGLALAAALFRVLVAGLPIDPAFRGTLELSWVGVVTALTLSVLVAGVVTIAPLRSLLRGDLSEGALTTRAESTGSPRTARLQSILVATEVVVAVLLVVGTSLLLRTVENLRSIDPGVTPDGVIAVDVLVSESETDPSVRAAFFDALVDRAEALPGVSSAGLVNRLPLRDGGYQGTLDFPGRPDLEGPNAVSAMYRPVTPGTFDALGIQILEGRGIQPRDVEGGRVVAVVSETFARRIWGGESPLGRSYSTFSVGPVEVVGVAEDVAVSDLVGEQPMVGYYSWDQTVRGDAGAVLVVRSEGDPRGLAGPLQALVSDLDARAVVGRVQTMRDVVEAELSEPLRLRFYLGLFSALAIVLGSVGVFGLVAYSVKRRKAEFGIRLALGASPGRLVGLMVRRGLLPVILGIVGGAALAFFASRALRSFLFGVQPADPVSFATAAAVLLLAGVAAAAIPAMAAGATDPATSLRAE